MKTKCLLLFLIIPFVSFSQKIERYYDMYWSPSDESKATYYSVMIKQDSIWHQQDFFRNTGYLQMDGYFKDTADKIHHGVFHYYHANKLLLSTGAYIDNKRHGLWLSFHSNGMMSDSVIYDSGRVVGTRMGWYPNGYLSDSSVWNLDGRGVEVTCFDNGTLSSVGMFRKGKQNGKWKYYHRNGNPSAIEIFNYGSLVSRQYFDEEGKLIADTTNKDRKASFVGGNAAWKKYLEKRLYFPDNRKIVNANEVVVMITAIVDEEGNLSDVEVSLPFHPDFVG